jgi:hypothetical protein
MFFGRNTPKEKKGIAQKVERQVYADHRVQLYEVELSRESPANERDKADGEGRWGREGKESEDRRSFANP